VATPQIIPELVDIGPELVDTGPEFDPGSEFDDCGDSIAIKSCAGRMPRTRDASIAKSCLATRNVRYCPAQFVSTKCSSASENGE
jgi:hypothetical protein